MSIRNKIKLLHYNILHYWYILKFHGLKTFLLEFLFKKELSYIRLHFPYTYKGKDPLKIAKIEGMVLTYNILYFHITSCEEKQKFDSDMKEMEELANELLKKIDEEDELSAPRS